MARKARNELIAFGSIFAVAIGVALALPPSSSATDEDDGQSEVQESEPEGPSQGADSAEDSSTVEPDPACTDENGQPLPTVSNPCWADANSARAQALSCDAVAGNEDGSDEDRRWYIANCLERYEVLSENEHGIVITYEGSTFYLGKDCDVRSAKYGKGRWEWANGGWVMSFESGERFGFPRIDAPMGEEACRS